MSRDCRGSLESCGGDVRIVQGIHKAIEIAKETDNEVVFISLGFETTAPTVAAAIAANPPKNFSILSCHRLVPPTTWLLEQGEAALHGFILPGHVGAVIGYGEYQFFPVPQVVAGFEPEEILFGLLMLTRQVPTDAPAWTMPIPGPSPATAISRPRSVRGGLRTRRCRVARFSGHPRLRPPPPAPYRRYDAQERFHVRIAPTPKATACIC